MTPEITATLSSTPTNPQRRRRAFGLGALLAAGAMSLSLVAPAMAQPEQRGLVNVNVGDVTVLENVGIGVGAQVAAQICAIVQVGQIGVLAEQTARGGQDATLVCEIEQGDVDVPVTITR
jgi:hypothetical protein